ncbi:MAG: formate/nitrite transporter family protein [Candidatus Eremiobacteraeota bacterium]|nr:formate/nitrite transporter family protein [Candidatus Eremiobacteraeota bacterium]
MSTPKNAPAKAPDGDASVPLTKTEEEQVRKRTGLRAAVVFETIRREGESELNRPVLSLAFSGLAAGLSMGFSLVVTGVLRANLPDAPWRILIENLGYTIGFLIVVLGRQQLFSENTVTAILPLLQNASKGKTLMKVARLWAAVLAANLTGAGIFAAVVAHSSIFPPDVQAAFLQLAKKAAEPDFWTIVLRGIFAGWLIALMVWLLPAADTQKLWVVIIITYVVGAAGLSHIIAGSVEVLYGVAVGAISWSAYFGAYLLPVFIGNTIGGVLLVSLLNYGQVAPENPET